MLETTPPVPAPRPFTARSLVGMSMRTRREYAAKGAIVSGERLRPCLVRGWPCVNCAPSALKEAYAVVYRQGPKCSGDGVLPAKRGRR